MEYAHKYSMVICCQDTGISSAATACVSVAWKILVRNAAVNDGRMVNLTMLLFCVPGRNAHFCCWPRIVCHVHIALCFVTAVVVLVVVAASARTRNRYSIYCGGAWKL